MISPNVHSILPKKSWNKKMQTINMSQMINLVELLLIERF
jgi:hypothetical protein